MVEVTGVGVRADPSALRWLIGNELRLSRERVGRKQSEAAGVLSCSQAKINYLEIGRNTQRPEEVTALLRFYGADVAVIDRLAALAGRADGGTWWADFEDVVPNWFATFVGLEGLAESEFAYETMTLPGLLQTADYAGGLLGGHLRVPVIDVEQVVNLRMARQDVLDAELPLRFTTVIEESVLDRAVGGHDAMQAQLRHLLTLTERDNVNVQVMPLSVPVHDGLDGEFMLLDFREARSIGYIEYPTGAVYIQDHDQLSVYAMAAERLCEAALSPLRSRDAIAARIE